MRHAKLVTKLRPHVRALSTEHRQAIQRAVDATPVVVFMKGTPQHPQCGFSKSMIHMLEQSKIHVDQVAAYDCLADDDLRNGIKEFSSWPTIPQLYVKGEFIGGSDIVSEMYASGQFQKFLKEKEIILDQKS